MTIFLVVNSFPRVSETFLFNLVTELELKGVLVWVLALSPSGDQAHFASRSSEWSGNLKVMPQTMPQWVNFCTHHPGAAWNGWRSWRKGTKRGKALANTWLTTLVQAHHPEWVHFAYSGIGVQFLEAIQAAPNQRWMVSCRGSAEIVAPLVNPRRGEELRLLFQAVTSIHCVSQHMVQTIVRWGAPVEKTFVNFPSIDPVRFRRSVPYPSLQPGQPLLIVSTGRLNFQKGYPYALMALCQLQQLGVDFQYHIIGDGEDRSEVVYLIEALNLSGKVVLHGKCSSVEVQAILEQAHVFLLTSLYEGIANAALEALALEIPIISTRAGGMEEVIQSGTNGVLIDCFAVEDIADALAKMVQEPSQLTVLGKQGRQTVIDHHLLEHQIGTFLKKYT